MALLPVKKAKELGDIMAKNGVSGAIAMKSPPPSDEESDESSDDYDKSELDSCIDDLADAFESGDKEAFKSALHDLVDCIRNEDEEQDEQLGM